MTMAAEALEQTPLEAKSPYEMRVHLGEGVPDTDVKSALKTGDMGFLHSYTTGSFVDGPGMRLVAWTTSCMFRCRYCHNPDTWTLSNGIPVTLERAVEGVRKYANGLKSMGGGFTLSGGEPLMHDLSNLTHLLQRTGFATHIETSGAYPLTGSWDWICVSPKKFKRPLKEVLQMASELKVVVYNKSDFRWAEDNAALVSQQCQLYLQPEWSKANAITPLIIDYIKSQPRWQLSLQIHKYINIP